MEPKDMSADKLLQNIKAQEDLGRVLASQVEQLRKLRHGNLKLLESRILDGQTTGNEIHDFLAVHPDIMRLTDFDGGPVGKMIAEINGRLKAAEGEPVMQIATESREMIRIRYMLADHQGQSLIPPPDLSYDYYIVDIGLLSCPKLFFYPASRELCISSGSWTRFEIGEEPKPSPGIRDPQPASEGISQKLVLPPLSELVARLIYPQLAFPQRWEILIGWQEVLGWQGRFESVTLRDGLERWFSDNGAPSGLK